MRSLIDRYLGFLLCIPVLIAGGYLADALAREWIMYATLAACMAIQITYVAITPWWQARQDRKRQAAKD